MDNETTAPAEEPALVPSPSKDGLSPGRQLAGAWFNTHVANSPAAQFTPGLNHLSLVALPALAADIDALLTQKG